MARSELTQKEMAFAEAYTSLGEPTCGNATASAASAGYGTPRNAGWRLMQRSIVREAIKELHEQRMDKFAMTPARVLHDLEHARMRALEKGDIYAAVRASELQGKFLAMFSDRVDISALQDVPVLSEEERAAADRLAEILLLSPEVEKLLEADSVTNATPCAESVLPDVNRQSPTQME